MKRNTCIAITASMLVACRAEQPTGNQGKAPPTAQVTKPDTPVVNAGTSEAGSRSRFTSIEPTSCQLLEENREEGGWWRRLCKGPAGYDLELSESDLRQDMVVIPASGHRSELGLTEVVANGAFNALGKTTEWRGADLAAPDALIVRFGVAADPEGRKPDISNLIVARLKPTACIVAVVPPGAGQNERARVIADGKLPACLKT